VEGLPCFKMAALLTHSFQWTAVAKVTSSVYVYVITQSKSWHHITPVLKKLHWVPISHRITYKILVLTNKAIYHLAPSLTSSPPLYQPSWSLRSTSAGLLCIHKSKLRSFGDRAFSRAALGFPHMRSTPLSHSPSSSPASRPISSPLPIRRPTPLTSHNVKRLWVWKKRYTNSIYYY